LILSVNIDLSSDDNDAIILQRHENYPKHAKQVSKYTAFVARHMSKQKFES